MKTLQELFDEIKASKELDNRLAEAVKNDKIIEFFEANGVETTLDDIKAFLKDRTDAKLSADDLEGAAGVDKGKGIGTLMICVGC